MKFIQLAKISSVIFFLNIIYADNLQSEIKTDSIIKIFCKESVKSEFKRNNFEYVENIGEEVCNCYMKNISKNITHKESISNCKKEKLQKINL